MIMTDVQRIYPAVIFSALIIACGFLAGCTVSSPQTFAEPSAAPSTTYSAPLATAASTNTAGTSSTYERVEVYHFHGTQQCYSCITLGDLAEKTVNASFRDELASGRLVFAHVNYDLPENAALKKKYGVTGSSLWIGVYDADGFHKKQDTKLWYLIDDENAYSAYLSGLITRRLNGDLS